MPIPASDVFGGSTTTSSDSGPISADKLFAKKAEQEKGKTSLAGDAARTAAGPAKDYWTHFTEISNQYLSHAKKNFADADKQETVLGQISSVAKGFMNLGGAVWSPVEGAVDTFASHPIQQAVDKAADKIEEAAPDKYTAQERREASLSGKPLPEKNGPGITKDDVRRTAEGLKSFIDIGLQTGAGMVGGEESVAGRGLKAADKAGGAGAVEKAGEVLGPTQEKPRLRVVGTDAASGKPRVRAVSPEEASAKVVQAVSEIHQQHAPGWTIEVRGPEMAPWVKDHPLETPKTQVPSQAFQEWGDLHYRMQGTYQRALISGEEVPAHQLLDEMIANTSKEVKPVAGSMQTAQASYLRPYLEKLRSYVENVPVKIAEKVEDTEGNLHDKYGGLYRPGMHDVQVRADLPNPFMTISNFILAS